MTNAFDYVKSINTKDRHLWNEESDKEYSSFVVNRAFSNTHDTVLFSNEININNHIPDRMKYDFYFYGVPKNKSRFGKWNKQDSIDELEVIKEYYDCSNERAMEIGKILSHDQKGELKKRIEKGGRYYAK